MEKVKKDWESDEPVPGPFCLFFLESGHTEPGGDIMEVRRYVNGKPVSGKDLPRQQVDNPVLVRLLRQARSRGQRR